MFTYQAIKKEFADTEDYIFTAIGSKEYYPFSWLTTSNNDHQDNSTKIQTKRGNKRGCTENQQVQHEVNLPVITKCTRLYY